MPPSKTSRSQFDRRRVATIDNATPASTVRAGRLALAPRKFALRPLIPGGDGCPHINPRTEEIFVEWIRRFVLFHDKRHPRQMGEAEVVRFLSHLAAHDHVSLSAQIQARAAIVFLYRHVLERPLSRLEGVARAKPSPPARPRGERRSPDRDEILSAKPDPLR